MSEPILDTLILNNATVTAGSSSEPVHTVFDANHADVLIRVGTKTGSPVLTFYLDVIEPTSGATIRTYPGIAISTATTSDYITVDGLTLGTRLKVRYAGTLDADNKFSGVYCRLVVKR
ncbi:hypothetical protein ANME2D_02333 [Candidatus Methanoperedens nitroreducens]|uniref:Uncharacterized protein n=1 Tax=Candidatus Methanoperedens nitratireducens TaxID=1392998 RepID=A0A062V4R7_9EURY|nr:hypothetical protein [Candidatus Methanoperedens nitroreducens]KCZ71598.1 hypothetical protein ANME2D_02333 [Candidatus Methanoperedens nitroreducens]MDJ1421228.1 hypothetical protein [Candidatus Methanoperedens sp.]